MDGNFYLDALVKGDSRVISKIYETNFKQVKRFILQNKGNTEDIFQKALLQITVRHKKEGISIKSTFKVFLFKVYNS